MTPRTPNRHPGRARIPSAVAAEPERSTPPAAGPRPRPHPPVAARVYGPRERIAHLGEPRLSDAECLALILRTGHRGASAEQIAHSLLRTFGGLPGLAAAELRELARQRGMGPVRAAAVGAAFGLVRRLAEARCAPGRALRSAADVAAVVRALARGSGRESFYALLLDGRHRILSLKVISTGHLEGAPVHPREVFRPAIREGAAALVVAHNHPSGDPAPSTEDRLVTERLREAATLVGIALLDHVVVGEARYFSFAEEGYGDVP